MVRYLWSYGEYIRLQRKSENNDYFKDLHFIALNGKIVLFLSNLSSKKSECALNKRLLKTMQFYML
jgi:hypothetical protein